MSRKDDQVMSKQARVWLTAAIVTLLIAMAIPMVIPRYMAAMQHTRETTLAANLLSMRHTIDQYTADKKKAPQTLQDLVDAGYYRKDGLPLDPITNSRSTWQPVIGEVVISPGKTDRGITDIHSGSSSISSNGTSYRSW